MDFYRRYYAIIHTLPRNCVSQSFITPFNINIYVSAYYLEYLIRLDAQLLDNNDELIDFVYLFQARYRQKPPRHRRLIRWRHKCQNKFRHCVIRSWCFKGRLGHSRPFLRVEFNRRQAIEGRCDPKQDSRMLGACVGAVAAWISTQASLYNRCALYRSGSTMCGDSLRRLPIDRLIRHGVISGAPLHVPFRSAVN